jgi:hypothetical protein
VEVFFICAETSANAALAALRFVAALRANKVRVLGAQRVKAASVAGESFVFFHAFIVI